MTNYALLSALAARISTPRPTEYGEKTVRGCVFWNYIEFYVAISTVLCNVSTSAR